MHAACTASPVRTVRTCLFIVLRNLKRSWTSFRGWCAFFSHLPETEGPLQKYVRDIKSLRSYGHTCRSICQSRHLGLPGSSFCLAPRHNTWQETNTHKYSKYTVVDPKSNPILRSVPSCRVLYAGQSHIFARTWSSLSTSLPINIIWFSKLVWCYHEIPGFSISKRASSGKASCLEVWKICQKEDYSCRCRLFPTLSNDWWRVLGFWLWCRMKVWRNTPVEQNVVQKIANYPRWNRGRGHSSCVSSPFGCFICTFKLPNKSKHCSCLLLSSSFYSRLQPITTVSRGQPRRRSPWVQSTSLLSHMCPERKTSRRNFVRVARRHVKEILTAHN